MCLPGNSVPSIGLSLFCIKPLNHNYQETCSFVDDYWEYNHYITSYKIGHQKDHGSVGGFQAEAV